jgi:hypothetical protein
MNPRIPRVTPPPKLSDRHWGVNFHNLLPHHESKGTVEYRRFEQSLGEDDALLAIEIAAAISGLPCFHEGDLLTTLKKWIIIAPDGSAQFMTFRELISHDWVGEGRSRTGRGSIGQSQNLKVKE